MGPGSGPALGRSSAVGSHLACLGCTKTIFVFVSYLSPSQLCFFLNSLLAHEHQKPNIHYILVVCPKWVGLFIWGICFGMLRKTRFALVFPEG